MSSGFDGCAEEACADAAGVSQGLELRQEFTERGAEVVRLLQGQHLGGVGGVFGVEALEAEVQVRDVRVYGGRDEDVGHGVVGLDFGLGEGAVPFFESGERRGEDGVVGRVAQEVPGAFEDEGRDIQEAWEGLKRGAGGEVELAGGAEVADQRRFLAVPAFNGQDAGGGEDGLYATKDFGEGCVVCGHFEDLVQGSAFGKAFCADEWILSLWLEILIFHAEANMRMTACTFLPHWNPNLDVADVFLEVWVGEEPHRGFFEAFRCALDLDYTGVRWLSDPDNQNTYRGDRFSAAPIASMLAR